MTSGVVDERAHKRVSALLVGVLIASVAGLMAIESSARHGAHADSAACGTWTRDAASEIPPPSGFGSRLLLSSVTSGPGGDWAVGWRASGDPFSTLVLHYESSMWRRVPTSQFDPGPYPYGYVNLTSVVAPSADQIWIAGDDIEPPDPNTGVSNHPFLARFNGTTFVRDTSLADVGDGGVWQTLSAVTPNNIWAVGSAGAAHFDGAHWSMVAVPAPPQPADNAMLADVAADSGAAYFMGETQNYNPTFTRTPWLLRHDANGWAPLPVPSIAGAVPSTSAVNTDVSDRNGHVWLGGIWDDGNSRHAYAAELVGAAWQVHLLPDLVGALYPNQVTVALDASGMPSVMVQWVVSNGGRMVPSFATLDGTNFVEKPAYADGSSALVNSGPRASIVTASGQLLVAADQAGDSVPAIYRYGLCGAPTGTVSRVPRFLAAVPYPRASARLTWKPPASDGGSAITGYEVKPFLGSVAQPTRVFNSPRTTALVTGLRAGKKYRFQIAARNAIGLSPWSAKSGGMTVGAPGRPGKVTARVASGSLRVTFTAPSNNGAAITNYEATCTSSNGGATTSKTRKAGPITLTGATRGKRYNCVVRATNRRGTGPASKPTTAVIA